MKNDTFHSLINIYASEGFPALKRAALEIAAREKNAYIADNIRKFARDIPSEDTREAESFKTEHPFALIKYPYIKDICAHKETKNQLAQVVLENRSISKLNAAGLQTPNKILFYGPSGCGKSFAAKAFAREMGIPLCNIDLSRQPIPTIDSYLAEVFQNIKTQVGVYLFTGLNILLSTTMNHEAFRGVSILISLLSKDFSPHIKILEIQDPKLLPEACINQIDVCLQFPRPDASDIYDFIRALNPLDEDINSKDYIFLCNRLANIAHENKFSYLDVIKSCEDYLRNRTLATNEQPHQTFRIAQAFQRRGQMLDACKLVNNPNER